MNNVVYLDELIAAGGLAIIALYTGAVSVAAIMDKIERRRDK